MSEDTGPQHHSIEMTVFPVFILSFILWENLFISILLALFVIIATAEETPPPPPPSRSLESATTAENMAWEGVSSHPTSTTPSMENPLALPPLLLQNLSNKQPKSTGYNYANFIWVCPDFSWTCGWENNFIDYRLPTTGGGGELWKVG